MNIPQILTNVCHLYFILIFHTLSYKETNIAIAENTEALNNLSNLDSSLSSTSQRHYFILQQTTIINSKIVHSTIIVRMRSEPNADW